MINQRRFNISAIGLVPKSDRNGNHDQQNHEQFSSSAESFLGPVQHKNEKLLLNLEHLL